MQEMSHYVLDICPVKLISSASEEEALTVNTFTDPSCGIFFEPFIRNHRELHSKNSELVIYANNLK